MKFVDTLQNKLKEMAILAGEMERDVKALSKCWYDKMARERTFQVGDQVLLLLPEDSCHTQLSAEAHTG